MKQRCYNEKSTAYKNYGGRGIRVCDRWRDSFVAFLQDVGRRPEPHLTLERIDNDGHYEPNNVRWATREQVHNTRLTHEERVRRGRLSAAKRWHPELVTHPAPTE